MSYIIFGDTFSFPEGGAATNRALNYAKGFKINNMNVDIICFDNEYLEHHSGIYEGINYYHPLGQTKRNKNIVKRNWYKFLKYFKTFQLIKSIRYKEKISAIHCYTSSLRTQLFAFSLARFYKTKFILERGEHPLQSFTDSFFKQIQGSLRVKVDSKLSDSIFCISNYLVNFYFERGVKLQKLFLIPSTVDTERFNNKLNPPLSFDYILYCGGLTAYKDGINILIESFSRIYDKFQNINLVLIGKSDTLEEELFFKGLVEKLNITERTFFLGELPRKEIPAYLCNAKILSLARPKSMVADAGFPSKLTEYLATGNPVIVTEVGDIPLYLFDNKNAFLAKPDSIDSFTQKLDYVLSNYKFAQQVGLNGKKLTSSVFNYKFQALRIIDYLNSGQFR